MKAFWGLVALVLVLGGSFIVYRSIKSNNTSPLNATVNQAQELVPTVSQQTEQATAQTVKIDASGYSPSKVTVKRGMKITWENVSGKTVNVSSDPHPAHTNYTPLNLGNIPDKELISLVFNETGTFNYHNHLQPSQKGTITVQ